MMAIVSQTATREALQMQARGSAPASQATTIEQSRAIAQVQGALVVAQQRPRDTIRAADRMREACSMPRLADRAFFRYRRGDAQVTGPSIHLATELARCWGNVDYGITELRRDDDRRESEMLAYAWDLETNNRVTNSFIVPHKRDVKGGPKELVDLRDIYENNANNAARRLRECIFRVLPTAFVEEAKEVCEHTLSDGGGEPLPKRREACLTAFAAIGVTRRQIERKMGRAADALTDFDLGTLRVVLYSIRRGEATVGDEFEDDRAESIAAQLKQNAPAAATDVAPASDEDPDATMIDYNGLSATLMCRADQMPTKAAFEEFRTEAKEALAAAPEKIRVEALRQIATIGAQRWKV